MEIILICLINFFCVGSESVCWVHVYIFEVSLCTRLCVYEGKDQRSVLNISFNRSFSTLVFETGSFIELAAHQSSKTSWPLSCSDLPTLPSSTRIFHTCYHAWLSMCELGIWAQLFIHVQQELYWLNRGPEKNTIYCLFLIICVCVWCVHMHVCTYIS